MTGDLSLFAAMFPKAYAAAVEFDKTMSEIRAVLGSDGAELAGELARTTYLNQQQAADAVMDCWAYGKNLEQTETVVRRADSARLSVRAVLQLEAQAHRHPATVAGHNGLVDWTKIGHVRWPLAGEPSTLREDLDAAIEAVAAAPYEPRVRYRSGAGPYARLLDGSP